MDKVLEQIRQIAVKYNVKKIVLFGSRARGNHSSVSDYDIAVFAKGLSVLDQARLWSEVEEIDTLKKIDLTFVDEQIMDEFRKNINKDGVIIYEQGKQIE